MDGSVVISNTAPMYWQADAGSGLSGGTYNLSLTAEGTTGVADINTRRIIKRPSTGGTWIIDGTAGINSGTTNAPVIVRNGISGFSQFTFGSDNTNTLPVKLLYFSGKLSGKNIVMSWATAIEDNSDYFEIESGKNGNDFTGIGKVENTVNTSQQSHYTFTAYGVSNATNYFRLKEVDADGGYTYSNISATTINQSNTLKLYPTIVSQQITVAATNDAEIKVYNINGQFVQKLLPGINDISRLPGGIYLVTDEEKNIIQFIKQ